MRLDCLRKTFLLILILASLFAVACTSADTDTATEAADQATTTAPATDSLPEVTTDHEGGDDAEKITEGVSAPVTEEATQPSTEETTEEETESETFIMDSLQNPLSAGAAPDPVVVYHDGYYYATFTEALGIAIYRSRDLKTVLTDEKNIIMNLTDEVQGNVWAPELHYNPATDRWYVYASGSRDGWDFSSIRMFCLESVTSDPFGAYIFKGYTDPDVLAIDQTVFYDEASGTLYTAYSQFTGKGQVIMLAVMENPWTISDQRMEISYPRYLWEKKGKTDGKDERVNEGPVFLCRDGKLSLIYSASGCWSQYYCLGLIDFRGEDFTVDSVMQKDNWSKHKSPVFQAANGVYGVGHCFFFTTPDGETWISYHGMATPDAGEGGRYMYVQPITFDEAGLPVLGEPLSRDTVIDYPLENKEY